MEVSSVVVGVERRASVPEGLPQAHYRTQARRAVKRGARPEAQEASTSSSSVSMAIWARLFCSSGP
ncbi:MAG: hypothetical protein VW687_14030, partial [Curvibacter sp.]